MYAKFRDKNVVYGNFRNKSDIFVNFCNKSVYESMKPFVVISMKAFLKVPKLRQNSMLGTLPFVEILTFCAPPVERFLNFCHPISEY